MVKPMKIAMLGHKRIPSREGGVEIVVEELSTRIAKLGNDVTVYNRSGKHALDKNQDIKDIDSYKGVKIKKVLTIDKKGLAAVTSSFFATLKILFSKADVVHYHAEGPCYWMFLMKWFSKKKIVATIHGLDWQRSKWGGFATKFIKKGEERAVKYADEIIVLSKNVQKYFKDTYNRETVYIPNGVSKLDKVEPSIITEKYGLTNNSYILFLGRLVPEKGIHYLIEAYKKLNTNKKLVIAGGASDTNTYFDELKELAKDNKNIIFTGFVQGKEMEELYSNAYIYCLPSDLEGMPLSLLEAMSYGNCCVTSDIKELTEVIPENKYIFKSANIEKLGEILQFLIDNPDVVKKYQDISQEYILNKYSWDNVVEETLELYRK